MKKLIVPVLAVTAFATLAFAGENYFHTVKAEFGAFASRLGVGVTEPSSSYVLDVAGPMRLVGAPTITGAPVVTGNPTITGNPAVTGAASVVGSVAVSTSASSTVTVTFKGAVVTLSTRPATVGEIWFQSSDYKLYLSTRVPAHNDATCSGTFCYSALN